MSTALSLYLLETERTRAWVGSGDQGFLRAIRAEFAAEIADDDDWFADAIAAGAPTAAQALEAVVNGGPYEAEHAFQYGYAYRRICAMGGPFLDNSSFSPYRGDWLSMVDEGLRAVNVTAVRVAAFDSCGLPSGLPYTHVPGCGAWSPEECERALVQFEEGRRLGLAPVADRDVAEAVEQVVGWLRRVPRGAGYGIVGFRS
ncbi:hypothetical protein [Streptomyces sp. NPDC048606]|uniref:DUF7691 family protein n=1 Tax=Streptomyces sp. NPDC048606 TaxID=3154726 RepID=UPI003412F68A